MDSGSPHGRSELFLVRLWENRDSASPSDSPSDNQAGWYGTVQHTVSGRIRNFNGWDGLNTSLLEMLQTLIHGSSVHDR